MNAKDFTSGSSDMLPRAVGEGRKMAEQLNWKSRLSAKTNAFLSCWEEQTGHYGHWDFPVWLPHTCDKGGSIHPSKLHRLRGRPCPIHWAGGLPLLPSFPLMVWQDCVGWAVGQAACPSLPPLRGSAGGMGSFSHPSLSLPLGHKYVLKME